MPLPERLYNLLPGIYQSYDAVQGEPLRALLALLEQELDLLETDTDYLYDNWFIETCEDWVVPYIGDLLNTQRLYSRSARRGQERRAFVANTLAYRRRKGTATVLEQLALNVSGWHGRAVEYLQLLARTPDLTTGAETAPGTVDLRRSSQLSSLSSPFETGAFTTEVRSRQSHGNYHPGSIGLFMWRLQSYPLTRVTARPIDLSSGKWRGRCYSFSPLGIDRLPLFNQPQTKSLVTDPTQEIHVPGVLRCVTLAQEIRRRRHQRVIGPASDPQGYFGTNPVLQIFLDGQTDALLPEQLLFTSLEQWESPDWQLLQGDTADLPTVRYEVAVDPELGRLVVLHRPLPMRVEVSFAYGFSADVGGGPYSRPLLPAAPQEVVWNVRQEPPFTDNPLAAAIAQWHETTTTWQACREQTCIVLAKLGVPPLPRIVLDDSVQQSKFQPGIITGLEVLAVGGADAVIVTEGQAIDVQGRLITLTKHYFLPLERYRDQTVLILATSPPPREDEIEKPETERVPIIIVPANLAAMHSNRTYIHLSLLSIDTNGKVISQSTSRRVTFQAGIINGLSVKNDQSNDVILSPGLAVNQQGQRIRIGINDRIKLPAQRKEPMLLLLSRRVEPGKPDAQKQRGQQWQLDLVAETPEATTQFPVERFLRLVRISASAAKSIPIDIYSSTPNSINNGTGSANGSVSVIPVRPTFQPGIVWGLKVIAYPGQKCAIVTSGLAIGAQGETISVPSSQRLRWRNYSDTMLWVFLLYESDSSTTTWRITLTTTRPSSPAIPLAVLPLDGQGRIQDLPDVDMRPRFKPGIVQPQSELQVTLSDKKMAVEIAEGVAVNAQGRVLSLKQSQIFDLSPYQGQTVLLFLSQDGRQGWRLGAVVEEATVGKIVLHDNSTYGKTDLQITVPPEKKLHIMSANGCRPHLWGNLTVQGSDEPHQNPGEFLLEGLLLEGQLTVLPGDLACLSINHCTLVPQQGGCVVQSLPVSTLPIDLDEWSIIALAMYYIHLIAQLIALNLNPKLAPIEVLTQLIQMGIQRMRYIITDLWQVCRSPQSPGTGLPGGRDVTANHEQLSLVIHSSICGAIHIDAEIEQLVISDSIIDADGQFDDQRLAIAVPSSPVALTNTTVLGGTLALSLTANNSLFTQSVTIWRKQIGCLRYCYVPDESQTPRRYHCQPDRSLENRLDQLPAKVTALAAGLDAENRLWLFAGTTEGVRCSRDEGVNWESANEGLTNRQVQTLAIDPERHQIYAGTTEGFIFACGYAQTASEYAQNQPLSWEPLMRVRSDVNPDPASPNTTHINQIVIEAGELFIATLGGRIFCSSDWIAPRTGLEDAIWNMNALAIHPKTGWLFAGTAGTGVYYSSDRNQTWRKAGNLNLTNQMITALTIADDGRLFAGTSGAFTKDSGIYYSTNNGETWTFVHLPLNQRTITMLLVHKEFVFAGTLNGGLLRSRDHGQTWEPLAQLPHRQITALTSAPNGWILAGTGGGMICRSIDNGDNWAPINQGFNNAEAKLSILNQLQPSFASTQYGDPGYAQLSLTCADEIRMGAEDCAEIGGFNSLKQPQRIANLDTSLQEYSRFGLTTSIFYIT
ncbi:MAG: sialidase family protein [Kovacikia sp.]